MFIENHMPIKANSMTGKSEYRSHAPRAMPATAPNAAAANGPSKPPLNSQGMAEKTISAEPGASAGRPGRGRTEPEVSLTPRNRFNKGTSASRKTKSPHSFDPHFGWDLR
ncbi:MAG: hypothetical protein DPW15_14615 [Chloroflexi bacterium]|nr:hypothetical protein [Chloroflexota bacterium]